MFIANQVDEAAMGVSRDYTNFLQVGAACGRGIGTAVFDRLDGRVAEMG